MITPIEAELISTRSFCIVLSTNLLRIVNAEVSEMSIMPGFLPSSNDPILDRVKSRVHPIVFHPSPPRDS
jgi:hypothetical protein